MSRTTIELEDGKYTLVREGGVLQCLRYGEPWRDLTGDKMVNAMMDEIDRLASAQEAAPEDMIAGLQALGFTKDECIVMLAAATSLHMRRIERAALAPHAPAPVQAAPTEPVAWRYRHLPTVGWSYSEHRHPRNDLRQEPLYATPAPVAAEELLTEIRKALNASGVWHLGMDLVEVIKLLIKDRK